MSLQERLRRVLADRKRHSPAFRSASRAAPRIVLEFVEEQEREVLSFAAFVENVLVYMADVFSKVFLASTTLEDANLDSAAELHSLHGIVANIHNDTTIVQKHLQILENVLRLLSNRAKLRQSYLAKEQQLIFVKKRFFFLSREVRHLGEREKELKSSKMFPTGALHDEAAAKRALADLQARSLKHNNRMIADYNESIQREQNELAQEFRQEKTDAKELLAIEQTIGNINSLYNKLAEVVALQNDHFDRIDENIDLALENTEAAVGDLEKVLATVKNNRWFIVKVGAVGAVAGLLLYYFA